MDNDKKRRKGPQRRVGLPIGLAVAGAAVGLVSRWWKRRPAPTVDGSTDRTDAERAAEAARKSGR